MDPVAERREVADGLTRELAALDGVSAVVVFGSTARGDANKHSDLDLLVLTTVDADPGPVRRVCRDARPTKVSLVLHDTESFELLKGQDWLFVKHLANEGIALWDVAGEFKQRSRVYDPGEEAVIGEILSHGDGLSRLGDLRRYGTDFLFPLADVYGVAKRIAMLANARAGVAIFQREQALCACAKLYPQAASHIKKIEALAPFYAQTRGDRTAAAPFSSDGAGNELLRSVASLERIIATVSGA